MKPDSELQIQFSDFFTAQKVSIPVKFLLSKIAYLTGSSILCCFYSLLLSSKCRVRSRKIINMHNGRVSVELGRGKLLPTSPAERRREAGEAAAL